MRKLTALRVLVFIYLGLNSLVSSAVTSDSLFKEILFAPGKEAVANTLIQAISGYETGDMSELSLLMEDLIKRVITEGDLNAFLEALLIAANQFREERKYDQSILFYQKGALLYRQLSMNEMEADCYRRLSRIAWENGRYYLSLESGFRALLYYERSTEIVPRSLSYLYNTIALNYRALSQYEESFRYFQKGLEYAKMDKNESLMGLIMANTGRLFFLKGEYETALEYYEAGLELEMKSTSLQPVGRTFTSMAELFFYMNKPDSTWQYIGKALEIQQSINDMVGMSRTLSLMGFVQKREGNFHLALQNYNKSISLAERWEALEELRIALKGISRVYAVLGDYANAYNYYLQYSAIKERQFDISHLSDINQLEEKLKFEEKEREIQRLMLQRQKNLGLFFVLIALFALFLTVLFFILYRMKNQSLYELRKQSDTISSQKNELLLLNERLTEAKNKAEEADKLKSVFLSNMSHEIRTPMNAIIGFSNLLSDGAISENDRKMFVDIVQSNSKTLLQLIDDIIDFSKIEAGQLTITNREFVIDQLMEEIYLQFFNKMQVRNDKDIVLSFTKPPGIRDCRVLGDPARLNQVLSNLISNGIKFTPSGVVEFGYSIEKDNDESFVRFYVRDTGIGISPEKQKLIFERFRQGEEGTTRPFEGTGLGLTIAKGIVDKMGGKMWVESIVNQGSTFYFTIPYRPVLKTALQVDRATGKQESGAKFHGRKILIAEDETYNYIFLEKLLKSTGTQVLWAKDGFESIDLIKNHPDIDMILMDIKLPGINGLDATRRIRKFNRNVIIIAQTAYAMDEDRQKCLRAGCNDYISKPIEIKKFYDLIGKYMG